MFHKKKPVADDASCPTLRGRASTADSSATGGKSQSNPLARRFRADAEPATVELAGPVSFDAEPEPEEDPQTRPLETNAADLRRVISCDPVTGKFYVHPGGSGPPTMLQGEPVSAPTELRRGDSVRVGGIEIHFGSRS